jgi:hypothetical protein
MSIVQEIRIAAIDGLEIPSVSEGSTITITATLLVSSIHQEWVDITAVVGKPEQLPGEVIVGCVATEWSAT